jgi:hypothetical protein
MRAYALKLYARPIYEETLVKGEAAEFFSGGLVILVAVGIGRCVWSPVLACAKVILRTAGILRA